MLTLKRGDRVEYRDVNLAQHGTVTEVVNDAVVIVRWGDIGGCAEYASNLRKVEIGSQTEMKTK